MKRPIVVEMLAGDGAGKTSAMPTVIAALERSGRRVVRSREPGGTPFGEILRGLLLTNEHDICPHTQQLMMQASRVEHVRLVIAPTVARGDSVVLDRYLGTTVSHQGAGQGLSIPLIDRIHDETAGLRPDLLIVLDVDAEVGLRRSLKRNAEESSNETRYEGLELAFHERVRRSCLDQAEAMGDRAIVIDASRPQAEVWTDLDERLEQWLAGIDGEPEAQG